MNVITRNILDDTILRTADAICFTSNGVRKSNNHGVMGAGNAKAFALKWTDLPRNLGYHLITRGNCVGHLMDHYHKLGPTDINKVAICSFPTKNNWKDNSDLSLIIKSANELKQLADTKGWVNVFLCAPGVGMGQLRWSDVQPAIEAILDERFTVCFLK